MWSFEGRWRPDPAGLAAGTPVAVLAGLGVSAMAALTAVAAGIVPRPALAPAVVGVGLAGLLATALGWAARDAAEVAAENRPASPPHAGPGGPEVIAVILLAGAGVAAVAAGRVLYLASGGWLAWLALRGRLRPLGLCRPSPPAALLLGIALGAVLGGHLLVTAACTVAYVPRAELAPALAAAAYDFGANVPATELFFRGALLVRIGRRRSLGAALALSAAGSVLRYLLDPLLPKTPEVLAGTVFYIGLLGLGNGWLLWWSGSLVPGLAASLLFFAAYRTLGLG